MRFEGRLAQWNDERGFGFIEPTQGGEPVFVHISAFPAAGRGAQARPRVGERLSFEMDVDARGRKQALRVARPAVPAMGSGASPRVERDRGRQPSAAPRGSLGLVGILLSAALLAGLGWKGYQRWTAFDAGRGREPAALLAPEPVPAPAASPGVTAAVFRCDGRQHCSQMSSCAEAKFFLRNCPGVKMDGDGDGVPCEQQWCASPLAK